MRVYHIAKESGLANRVLLQMLHARGIDVPSHMAMLSDDQGQVLRDAVQQLRKGGTIAPKEEPAAEAAVSPGEAILEEARGSSVAGMLVESNVKVDVDDDPKSRGTKAKEPVRRKKGRDERRTERSEELLKDGLAEVLDDKGAVVPGTAAPVKPAAPAPTAPVPGGRAMSRYQQRRAPRTLVRQRRRGKQAPTLADGKIAVEVPITVKDLSQTISVRAQAIIKNLMMAGTMANMNTTLDEETVQVLALEFDREIEIKYPTPAAEQVLEDLEIDAQDPDKLKPRPPIVAVLGHVDHGKTSLLDAIRKTDVAAGEAGGITQHIGAYQVKTASGNVVTFLDTPGHEAFTAMRARGANVADVVILVVAADDGVMPQTEEAISHAQAAGVPIVVALNKIDKPNANRDRILNQLSTLGLVWDQWGGDTIVEPVSALKGDNVEHLVESMALTAEMSEIVADPGRRAVGTVIEATKNDTVGVTATLLVQAGTLRTGDPIVSGSAHGRVRQMFNDRGEEVDEAPPSMPVRVTGLDDVPEAGSRFYALDDLSTAKEIAEERGSRDRQVERTERPQVTLENVFAQLEDTSARELRVILKCDTKGSVEALRKKLDDLDASSDEISVRVLHGMVGAVSESDIKLAIASRAVVVGFHVLTESAAQSLAEREGIQIRLYQIIYEVVDDVKAAMEGMLAPEQREEVLGHATVKQVFSISKSGNIAGCAVTDGLIKRSAKARLYRDGKLLVGDLELDNLKRFKDDVREVKSGFECGIKLKGYDDIKEDDVIESFEVVEVKRTL